MAALLVRAGFIEGVDYERDHVTEERPQPQTDYSEDGVDLTLIRWMLSLTPTERLELLQNHVNAVLTIRELNARQ
jgi:hypothetical protein